MLKLADFVSTQEVSQKAFKNIQLKNSPGFLTTIKRDPMTNLLTITVAGINDLQYLETVSIYIDALLRITQAKDKKYRDLCSRKGLIVGDEEEKSIVDITAAKEMAYVDRTEEEEEEDDGSAEPLEDIVAPLVEEIVAPFAEAAAAEEPLVAAAPLVEEVPSENLKKQSNFLNMLFAEDEEEEEEEEDEDRFSGGATKIVNFKLPGEAAAQPLGAAEPLAAASFEEESGDESEKLKVDWTGKSLTHPNPFFQRLYDNDPSLFLTHDEGVYNAYIRGCAWTKSHRKQPVILTQKEKEEIDRKHPGSYENAVEYGSDPNKKFWYICPRYWSLKDNVSLTEEQVKSGKYGKIIPQDAKKIGKGENIFDFTDTKYHIDAKTNQYMNLQPGFLSKDSHPEGKCIPCCFKSWDSPGQIARRKECAMGEEGTAPVQAPVPALEQASAQALEPAPAEPAPAEQAQAVPPIKKALVPENTNLETNINYIKNSDKFPLGRKQYGFLPISVQKFLHTDNKKCQTSISNSTLKLNHTCFLRHGVEAHKTQSFIACIADIWSGDISDGEKFVSIREMKTKLLEAMTVDIFTTLQNGNLVDIFATSSAPLAEAEQTAKFAYNAERKEQVLKSYENFKLFLEDDSIEINYTYLWDLICQPNKKLFTKGINLVILEMKNDDNTDAIELICPSNHYSSAFFDGSKSTIILLKNGNYYEPIYTRTDTLKDITINRSFSLRNNSLLQNIKTTIELVKKYMNDKCIGLPSLPPTTYTFNTNMPLKQLLAVLQTKKYTVEKQVIHYNGKTIGVIVSKEKRGFLPCYPSAPVMDLNFIWMDEEEEYAMPYKETVDFLNRVYSDIGSGKIFCQPRMKMIEEELIVGVLTQTNQVIPVSQPEQDIYGDDQSTVYALPVNVVETDLNTVEKTLITSEKVDNERVEFIKKIRLETDFYNMFRNTVRTLLSEYEHKASREEIEEILSDGSELLYLEKLRRLSDILKKLLLPNIIGFVEYDTLQMSTSEKTITNCYHSDKCNETSFCTNEAGADTGTDEDEAGADEDARTNEKICKMLIPTENLINGQSNEKLYFGRIADELLRYSRVKSFIFQPKVFLSFSKVKYNLRSDEIILLQSLLTQDYFTGLVQSEVNPYIHQDNRNTYDTVQPQTINGSLAYSNKFNLEDPEAMIVQSKKKLMIVKE